MRFLFTYKYSFVFVLFLFVEIFIYHTINKEYEDQKNIFLRNSINSIQKEYTNIQRIFSQLAVNSFEGYINRVEIKKAFKEHDREKLYTLLKTKYPKLVALGFKQVHFHTPDNKSFLRLHEPSKFGDDLSDFRYTVAYVNRYKKPIEGLEIGRVLPGYRYVYPLFDGKDYLGSVELSFGLDTVEKLVESVYFVRSHFLISKSDFEKIVFTEDKKFYEPSNESSLFVDLRRIPKYSNHTHIENLQFDPQTQQMIDQKLGTKKPFAFEYAVGDIHNHNNAHHHYAVGFIPLSDLKNSSTIYLVYYDKTDGLLKIESEKQNQQYLFMGIALGVFIVIFILLKHEVEMRKSHELISLEEEKYQNLMALAADGIHIVDKNGNLLEASESFAKMLGYKYEECLQLNVSDWDIAIKKENLVPMIADLMKNPRIFLTKHKRKDGSTYDVQINAKGIHIGGIEYLYGSARDISEILAQQNELQDLNEKFKNAQSVAHIGSWNFDLVEQKLTWSDEIYTIFELDKKEFQPSYESFLNVIHPDDRAMIQKEYAYSLESKLPYKVIHRLLMHDGRIKWVEEQFNTKFDQDGKPLISIGTVQDITEKKQKDRLLLEQSRMVALGEMIGNIAHQWRQPLNVISLLAGEIIFKKELGRLKINDVIENMEEINTQVQYLSQVIDTFKNYIKGDKNPIQLSFQTVLENALGILNPSFKNHHIEIIKDFSDELITNKMIEGEIEEVLINIFNNANDILKEKNDPKWIKVTLSKVDVVAKITIEDNGGGIPNEILPRVFDPYFTTKHQSQGTGLGLHMCYKIVVESLKGKIYVNNTPNGAMFVLEIPCE